MHWHVEPRGAAFGTAREGLDNENVTITWTTDFVSLAVDAASGHDAESSHAGKICAFTISHVIIDSEGRDLDVQEIVFAWP